MSETSKAARNKQLVIDGFTQFAAGNIDVLRTLADDPRGIAVVDIWRLSDGQIVEHWDVVQPVPEAAQIPHGMF
ncbi:nuclear transport factor 2 family protein [Nonomuraea sediminis]|uniref:nuclear transport factor 2 family protein n=1 Tax=Nonomuraea sediminis TaxID=2835864 RepID=UPI001BDCA13C|nr:hypothetical protein [Nonomuraea sediminis]